MCGVVWFGVAEWVYGGMSIFKNDSKLLDGFGAIVLSPKPKPEFSKGYSVVSLISKKSNIVLLKISAGYNVSLLNTIS